MASPLLYKGMTRAELDAAYNNRAAVTDFAALMRGYRTRSDALYATTPCQRNLRYGPGERQTYDLLHSGHADAPIFLFIHGGYWQSATKEDFAFCAAGPLGLGYDVVLAEYTLAPEATMTRIVQEIGALLDHLAAQEAGRGRKAQIVLAGHSAGGHLAALYRAHPAVHAVLAISGLFDLHPISLTWLNDALQLTETEIASLSPSQRIGPGAPMIISVGAVELVGLFSQSVDYAESCRNAGEAITELHLPGCDHFAVLDDLADPRGRQLAALSDLIGRQTSAHVGKGRPAE